MHVCILTCIKYKLIGVDNNSFRKFNLFYSPSMSFTLFFQPGKFSNVVVFAIIICISINLVYLTCKEVGTMQGDWGMQTLGSEE